ncbi:MAG TPA: prepilin-type N-terminal cleavage/methylation domain-containing protein [Bacillota bacterium]|nr:prepilin-type N-terminal cleavage/methylation domain-containing protein [Bacillota bacterium]
MKTLYKNKLRNQQGLTLVEVLISIVIIALILLIILFVLLQIIRTNKTSQEIVSATYIAQTEMEELYAASEESDYDTWLDELANDDKEYVRDNDTDVITYQDESDPFTIKIKISQVDAADDLPLKRVIIYVYDQENTDKLKAKMENLLDWRSSDEASTQ